MTEDRVGRVLRICEEALDHEGEERIAYVDTACGADTALRRDIDAILVRADESSRGFLTAPPWRHRQPALAGGQRLGPYEVIETLGCGGMGAVYKARDSRLGRIVAIKVIGDAAIDPALRERFAREARTIAALNHLNICAIYDVGRAAPAGGDSTDALDFLVIEYLDGHTLARRVAAGRLPLDEALQVGIHVAEALAAAHRQGIVHGDIKPANVMLSSSAAGPVAKLLDFGLAELAPAPAIAGRAGTGRTFDPGAAPGTLPYMAPEQFQGKRRDARSDIFALGCVLYEMLTGRRAFAGDTQASIISAIVNGDQPRPRAVEPLTPPALDDLVARCLAKDPDERHQSAVAVAEELRRIAAEPASRDHLEPSPSLGRRWLWLGAAAVAVAIGAVASHAWRSRSRADVEPRTLVLPLHDGVDLGSGQSIEFSSDGRALIYFGSTKQFPALYWHDLNQPDGRLISGTESPGELFATPFASPDGHWLGFARAGKLLKMPIEAGRIAAGRSPVVLAGAVGWMRGANWGDDGTIVYAPNAYGGLWRVSADGGSPRELTRPDRSRAELSHRWPQVLPGARAALFTIQDASGRQDRDIIAAVELASGRVTRLVEGGSFGRYAPTGHLVYARNGSLFAVTFDPGSLTVSGGSAPVLGGVSMTSAGSGNAKFAISKTGALVYQPALPRPNAKNSLIWVDRDGLVEPVTRDTRAYQAALDLSGDGTRVAVRIEDPMRLDSQIWIYDISARTWRQVTFEGDNAAPLFSPHGDRIVFSSNRDGAYNLYVTSSNGDGPVERLTTSPYWQYSSSWSADGKLIAFNQQGASDANVWILSIADRRVWPWRPTDGNAAGARISPDGRWMAYQSEESGRSAVYVQSFRGSDPSVRVSGPNGGTIPFWSHDGRHLFYADGATLMTASVRPGVPIRVSAPHLAFVLPLGARNAGNTNMLVSANTLALAPDGLRVVLVQSDPERAPRAERLLLIPNWSEQLRTKAPRSASSPVKPS